MFITRFKATILEGRGESVYGGKAGRSPVLITIPTRGKATLVFPQARDRDCICEELKIGRMGEGARMMWRSGFVGETVTLDAFPETSEIDFSWMDALEPTVPGEQE